MRLGGPFVYGQNQMAVQLAGGQAWYPPAGQYYMSLGGQTVVQFFDPTTLTWRNLATGAASDLTVLDIDGDKGGYETLATLEREHEPLPHTQRVRTAHGEHVYLKYPGIHLKNTSGKLGAGLDIRCCGGYVVAPGAVHQSGHLYHWLGGHDPGQVPVGDVPEWLVAALTQNGVAQRSIRPDPSRSPDREGSR